MYNDTKGKNGYCYYIDLYMHGVLVEYNFTRHLLNIELSSPLSVGLQHEYKVSIPPHDTTHKCKFTPILPFFRGPKS